MAIVRGACPLDCPDTCSWLVTVEDGRAVELRGDRDHPFTRGALCGKVDHYLDALHDPGRVLHPLRRVGAKGEGRFERIPWDEAIELAAAGLQGAIERNGPESVLPYYYAGTMGMIQGWTLGPRLFAALGASRLGTTICTAAAKAGLNATLGGSVGFDPEDLGRARLVLLWGANLLATNLHQWRFVLEARSAGAHVVTIDPIRTETARRSDEHVALLPGTDAALALGLMRAVLDAGVEDRDWLERHTVGWPELEARLDGWPVERAAAVCGLEAEQVRALGERLAAARPTAIRLGLGLQRHGGAAAAIRAVCAIPAVTGDWRHPGGGVLSMTSGHFPIERDRVAFPNDLPQPPARTVNMARIGEALTELDDPPVAALVVFDSNPGAVAPNQLRVREGLAREDLFCVVLEQRLTDTTDFADLVLPATMQPEHADLQAGYGHLYLAWNEPAVEPPGECLPNTEIFRRLARVLGLDPSAPLRVGRGDRPRSARHARLPAGGHHARGAARARLDARGRLREGHGAVRRGRLPDALRQGRAPREPARGAGSRPARRLRAAARGRRRGARGALPDRARLAREPLLRELDVRLAPVAPAEDRAAADPPPSGRRRGPGDRERRRGRRLERPRLLPLRSCRRRRRAAGRRADAEGAVGEAEPGRGQRQRHDPRARHGPRRRADVPRQPRGGGAGQVARRRRT